MSSILILKGGHTLHREKKKIRILGSELDFPIIVEYISPGVKSVLIVMPFFHYKPKTRSIRSRRIRRKRQVRKKKQVRNRKPPKPKPQPVNKKSTPDVVCQQCGTEPNVGHWPVEHTMFPFRYIKRKQLFRKRYTTTN